MSLLFSIFSISEALLSFFHLKQNPFFTFLQADIIWQRTARSPIPPPQLNFLFKIIFVFTKHKHVYQSLGSSLFVTSQSYTRQVSNLLAKPSNEHSDLILYHISNEFRRFWSLCFYSAVLTTFRFIFQYVVYLLMLSDSIYYLRLKKRCQ